MVVPWSPGSSSSSDCPCVWLLWCDCACPSIPNEDCIFVHLCQALSPASPPVNPATFVDEGADEFPLPVESPPTSSEPGLRSVFVGRAAGRCQRRMMEMKCRLVEAAIRENQCRAPEWPDEDEFQPLVQHPFSAESCVIAQCQGQQIQTQYYLTNVAGAGALRQLHLYWIQKLGTVYEPLSAVSGCNTINEVSGITSVPTPTWTAVNHSVSVGPFGSPDDHGIPPLRTCSGQTNRQHQSAHVRSLCFGFLYDR